MFLGPARLTFQDRLSLLIICYWKSWNKQKPTSITLKTYLKLYNPA